VSAWARTSLGEQFRSLPLAAAPVARWLAVATGGIATDLVDTAVHLRQVRCLLLVRNMPHVPKGAYLYEPGRRRLGRLAVGDFGRLVQDSMFGDYMYLAQAPLIVLLVGGADVHRGVSGPVGYRVQHHVAGLLAQGLLAAAATDGISGHPVLGFTSARLDEPLGLRACGLTTLLLLPFAHHRGAPYLESGVHPAATFLGRHGESDGDDGAPAEV
jgi:hypothetical protein